jgi:hypothetical protein
MTADIVFMDIESIGLHPDAPVWEFAAIRRFANGNEDRTEFRIQHDPAGWLTEEHFPARFRADYDARYVRSDAATEFDAAVMINLITRGAHIIGAVPSFDTERLAKLIRRHGMEPSWHYHLIDVENVIVGFLAGGSRYELCTPPYDSNALSRAVGVDPDTYNRHTAMGDVLWVRAQWDSIMQPQRVATIGGGV